MTFDLIFVIKGFCTHKFKRNKGFCTHLKMLKVGYSKLSVFMLHEHVKYSLASNETIMQFLTNIDFIISAPCYSCIKHLYNIFIIRQAE